MLEAAEVIPFAIILGKALNSVTIVGIIEFTKFLNQSHLLYKTTIALTTAAIATTGQFKAATTEEITGITPETTFCVLLSKLVNFSIIFCTTPKTFVAIGNSFSPICAPKFCKLAVMVVMLPFNVSFSFA